MITGNKIIFIKLPPRSSIWKSWNECGTPVNRLWDCASSTRFLGKLEFCVYKPLSLYAHTPITACKFQAEFVIVIVIDSKKRSDFGTMHTIFEFQGRDLSFIFFSFFCSTALLKSKNKLKYLVTTNSLRC